MSTSKTQFCSKRNLEVVSRSIVPSGLSYLKYKNYLRHDFFYSCAYCTMTENEARGIRMVIDHYYPVSLRKNLENNYYNLMLACDPCNEYKSDIIPPLEARKQGKRFFRPDRDVRSKHFSQNDIFISGTTTIGDFTEDTLYLNRSNLLRIRRIRKELFESHQAVTQGIMALRSFPIDQLPKEVRAKAMQSVKYFENAQFILVEEIDDYLRKYSMSEIMEPENEDERQSHIQRKKQSDERLKEARVLYPGIWRGRQVKLHKSRKKVNK